MSNNSQIYAMGYEKWEGKRGRAIPAWLLIGQHSLTNLLSSSGCFARLLFIIFFSIYYFSLIIFTIGHFQLEALGDYTFFKGIIQALEDLNIQTSETAYHRHWILYSSLTFTSFTMLFYGSQLISKDKRANAMQVYFSKAISRADYLLGKYFAVGIITATVTLLPSAIILCMGVVLTTDHVTFFQESWYIPILSGAYWLLLTLSFGTITLMFSSFFTKSYMAGVSIIGFLIFFMVFSVLMVQIVGAGDMMGGTNWMGTIINLGDTIYSLEVTDWPEFIWQVIDLGILVAVCGGLTLRNIRPVEVVS